MQKLHAESKFPYRVNPLASLSVFSPSLRQIAWATILASLGISVWALWVDNVINNDGVEYVRAAQHFLNGDWRGGLRIYKWPFYPLFIAAVSKVTLLSAENAAHVVNALAFAGLSLAFLSVVIELGADKSTVIIAALVILFLPGLNEYRSFVIREPLYLCFYLIGLTYLFRYCRDRLNRTLLQACGFLLIGGLFRIEGAVLAVAAPWVLALLQRRTLGHKFRLLFWLIPLAVLGAFGLGMWLLASSPDAVENALQRPLAVARQSIAFVATEISDKLFIIREELLDDFGEDHAVGVLILSIAFIVIVETVKTLSIWHTALTAWAYLKGIAFANSRQTSMWVCLLVINLVILASFTLVKLFLTGRYPLALVLTALLAVPFAVNALWQRWCNHRQGVIRWLFPGLAVLLVVSGVEGLGLYTEKQHIKDAGEWIEQQSTAGSSLLTNNKILSYYAAIPVSQTRRPHSWAGLVSALRDGAAQKVDFVAIRLRSSEIYRLRRLQRLVAKPLANQFRNEKGDLVLVFR